MLESIELNHESPYEEVPLSSMMISPCKRKCVGFNRRVCICEESPEEDPDETKCANIKPRKCKKNGKRGSKTKNKGNIKSDDYDKENNLYKLILDHDVRDEIISIDDERVARGYIRNFGKLGSSTAPNLKIYDQALKNILAKRDKFLEETEDEWFKSAFMDSASTMSLLCYYAANRDKFIQEKRDRDQKERERAAEREAVKLYGRIIDGKKVKVVKKSTFFEKAQKKNGRSKSSQSKSSQSKSSQSKSSQSKSSQSKRSRSRSGSSFSKSEQSEKSYEEFSIEIIDRTQNIGVIERATELDPALHEVDLHILSVHLIAPKGVHETKVREPKYRRVSVSSDESGEELAFGTKVKSNSSSRKSSIDSETQKNLVNYIKKNFKAATKTPKVVHKIVEPSKLDRTEDYNMWKQDSPRDYWINPKRSSGSSSRKNSASSSRKNSASSSRKNSANSSRKNSENSTKKNSEELRTTSLRRKVSSTIFNKRETFSNDDVIMEEDKDQDKDNVIIEDEDNVITEQQHRDATEEKSGSDSNNDSERRVKKIRPQIPFCMKRCIRKIREDYPLIKNVYTKDYVYSWEPINANTFRTKLVMRRRKRWEEPLKETAASVYTDAYLSIRPPLPVMRKYVVNIKEANDDFGYGLQGVYYKHPESFDSESESNLDPGSIDSSLRSGRRSGDSSRRRSGDSSRSSKNVDHIQRNIEAAANTPKMDHEHTSTLFILPQNTASANRVYTNRKRRLSGFKDFVQINMENARKTKRIPHVSDPQQVADQAVYLRYLIPYKGANSPRNYELSLPEPVSRKYPVKERPERVDWVQKNIDDAVKKEPVVVPEEPPPKKKKKFDIKKFLEIPNLSDYDLPKKVINIMVRAKIDKILEEQENPQIRFRPRPTSTGIDMAKAHVPAEHRHVRLHSDCPACYIRATLPGPTPKTPEPRIMPIPTLPWQPPIQQTNYSRRLPMLIDKELYRLKGYREHFRSVDRSTDPRFMYQYKYK